MIFAADQIAEQELRRARWNGEHAKPEIDHVNRTSVVELPPVAHSGRHGHLA